MNNLIRFLFVVPLAAFGQTALTTAQIAKRVSPSVVVIQGKTGSGDLLGSGFIVSKDGKIVTNLHVIRDMKVVAVRLSSGEAYDSVSVLATDERRDLAIVRIAGFSLPTLELGDSDSLKVGEPLVIVGSPRGLEGTVTAGILSSVRDSGEGFKVLQTDAAVNPGNSGGPLVNNRGQAIGVVSFKLRSAEGLNFGVPINYVRGLLTNLQEPISLQKMRDQLGISASAHGQADSGPSADKSRKSTGGQTPINDVNFGDTIAEVRAHIALQACATQFTYETSCNAELTISGQPLKATLLFVSDQLAQVLCLSPNADFSSLLPAFKQQYGKPTWTDVTSLEREWATGEFYITLSPQFGFVAILRSYQAELRARNAKDAGIVSTERKAESNLNQTLAWLKQMIPLSTYHYTERIGARLADTTVSIVPVTLDSCTAAFDEVHHSIIQSEEYESYLTVRSTIPLGSLMGGGVKKVSKEEIHAVDDVDIWYVLLGAGSKVITSDLLHTSASMFTPFPGSPKIRMKGDDVTQRESVNHAEAVFSDRSVAQRILEASHHAADLCRGSEPF